MPVNIHGVGLRYPSRYGSIAMIRLQPLKQVGDTVLLEKKVVPGSFSRTAEMTVFYK
jgi:hypothetical protein